MIDFIACTSDFINFAERGKNKDGTIQSYIPDTGEHIKTVLKENELTLTHNRLQGSIHKVFNSYMGKPELTNSNDFNHSQLIWTIDKLEEEYSINFDEPFLTSLEIGFNLSLKEGAKETIDKVLLHKGKSPSKNIKTSSIHYKLFEYQQYKIKFYDKGLQMKKQNKNLLRIEVHFKRKQFNKHGIYSMTDLKDTKKLTLLFEAFLKKINEVIIVDSIPKKIDLKDRLFLLEHLFKLSNNIYSSRTKNYNTEKFNKLLERYNLLTTKQNLNYLLNTKFRILLFNDENVTNYNYSVLKI